MYNNDLFSLGLAEEIRLHWKELLTSVCAFLSTYIENRVFWTAFRLTVPQEGVGKGGWRGTRAQPSAASVCSASPCCRRGRSSRCGRPVKKGSPRSVWPVVERRAQCLASYEN